MDTTSIKEWTRMRYLVRLALVRLAQDRVKLRIKTANLLEEDSTLDDDQFSYKV